MFCPHYYYHHNYWLFLWSAHTVSARMYSRSEKVLEEQKVFQEWWTHPRCLAPEDGRCHFNMRQMDLDVNQVFSSYYCQYNLWLWFGVVFTEAICFQALSRVPMLPFNDYWSWPVEVFLANTANRETIQTWARRVVDLGVSKMLARDISVAIKNFFIPF